MILVDGELRLRPGWTPEDLRAAEEWYADPEVLHLSEGDEEPYDAATIRQMYEHLAGLGELYIIEVQEGGSWRPIGDATLAPGTIPICIGCAEYRSRGYGKRVLKLLIERARALGYARLHVKSVYLANVRARRLYERLGFKPDGGVVIADGQPSLRFVLEL